MENPNPYTLSAQECLRPENITKDICGYAITKFPIGKGGQAEVYLCIDRQSLEKVAVKVLRKDKLTSRGKENLDREIEIHKYISTMHDVNICNMLNTSEDDRNYYLFLEFLESDLVSYIEMKERLTEEEVKGIFKPVMEAISFLHSCSVVHRDIKAENFLVTLDNRGNIAKIKLCDFGLAQWTHTNKRFESLCGSPSYTGNVF